MILNIAKIDANIIGESLLVPSIFILIGSLGKKLVRGAGWERKDFFFGIELCLAAISGVLTKLFDTNNDPTNFSNIGLFIAICFGLFMYVLSLHQEHEGGTPKEEYTWLTLIANIIGIGLMFYFVVSIKGL